MKFVQKTVEKPEAFALPQNLIDAQEALQSVMAERIRLRAEIDQTQRAMRVAQDEVAAEKSRVAISLADGGSVEAASVAIRQLHERSELFALTIDGLKEKLHNTDHQARVAFKAFGEAKRDFGSKLLAEFSTQAAEALKELASVLNRAQAIAVPLGIELPGIAKTVVFDPLDVSKRLYDPRDSILGDPLCEAIAGALRPLADLQYQARFEVSDTEQKSQKQLESDRELRIQAAKRVFGTAGWQGHPLDDPRIDAEISRMQSGAPPLDPRVRTVDPGIRSAV